MIFKNGDSYIEVDEELSSDEIDTFEKLDNSDLEDTIELSLDLLGDVSNE